MIEKVPHRLDMASIRLFALTLGRPHIELEVAVPFMNDCLASCYVTFKVIARSTIFISVKNNSATSLYHLPGGPQRLFVLRPLLE